MNSKNNVVDSEEYKLFFELSNFGLVHTERKCVDPNCKKYDQTMAPYLQKRNKDAKNVLLYWRCSSCCKFKTVYDGSFFSLFRKSPKIVIELIKYWCAQLTIAKSLSLIKLNLEEDLGKEMVSLLFYRLRQM